MKLKLIAAAVAALTASSAWADGLKVNGFFNAAYSRSNSETNYLGSINQDGTFTRDTSVGLQVQAPLKNDLSFTVQAVADSGGSANDRNKARIDWAYLTYQANADLKVRAGRLRLPTYLYSDTLYVGYAQPWVRAPQEVYGLSTIANTHDGVDLIYQKQFAGIDWTVQPFIGSAKTSLDQPPVRGDLNFKRILGTTVSGAWKDLTVRAMHSGATLDVALTAPFPNSTTDTKVRFSAFGVIYDKDFLFIAERTRVTTTTSSGVKGTANDAWYATAGYHFGKFLPHVTFARDGKADDPTLYYVKSTTLGLRYDVSDGVALKAELQRVTPDRTPPLGASSPFTGNPAESNVTVLSLGLNVVF
jgi:hypothetical protein